MICSVIISCIIKQNLLGLTRQKRNVLYFDSESIKFIERISSVSNIYFYLLLGKMGVGEGVVVVTILERIDLYIRLV